jgi:23S rRNA (adenine2503-C2)-methyltransferase
LINLLNLTLEELGNLLADWGEPSFRAGQLFQWLHQNLATSFDQMTNLPKSLRQRLEENCTTGSLILKKRLVSAIDGTVKYLYGLEDAAAVEGVVMRYHHGNSLCISTQVGCRMGCGFCASTLGGLVRNLSAGEMLGEVYAAARDLPEGEKIGSIVLMGIGEPLDNFENVCKFLELLSHPKGFGMSLRHVSLSTCGLVDGIYKLAEKKYPLTLSVSLHAPDDEMRSALMPVNRKYNIDALLTACRDYFAKTGRRVSFEYTLIHGKTDNVQQARRLAALLKGMNCHVNLIPLNAVGERELVRSTPRAIREFQQELEKAGITATVRRELGADVMAACGQLRRES